MDYFRLDFKMGTNKTWPTWNFTGSMSLLCVYNYFLRKCLPTYLEVAILVCAVFILLVLPGLIEIFPVQCTNRSLRILMSLPYFRRFLWLKIHNVYNIHHFKFFYYFG